MPEKNRTRSALIAFCLMSSPVNAEIIPSPTTEIDPRQPSEIMCDIINIDPRFAHMIAVFQDGEIKLYDKNQEIRGTFTATEIAFSQRRFIEQAQNNGKSDWNVQTQQKLQPLFVELQGSFDTHGLQPIACHHFKPS